MEPQDHDSRYLFKTWSEGAYWYKQAEGELEVPSKVEARRSLYAQRKLSKGTGEHAGHLIGTQFGGPGGVENLGLQNPNINSFAPAALQDAFQGRGGSYHDLETHWKDLLEAGHQVKVIITDKYRAGQTRPFTRLVLWKESAGQPAWYSLDFANFGSPQKVKADAKRAAK